MFSARGLGLFSALLVAVHLRTAATLSICGSWQRAVVLRPGGLERTAILCTASNGLVNADSTLAQLRVYVKEHGLEVKTAGPGRNKEAILRDILRLIEGEPAGSQEAIPVARESETAVEEETVVPQTSEPPVSAEAEAATEVQAATEAQAATDAAPDAAPPDGFTWGATF